MTDPHTDREVTPPRKRDPVTVLVMVFVVTVGLGVLLTLLALLLSIPGEVWIDGR